MTARAIMLQGTASNVGKSLLVAGLARALRARGLRVLPFKPQNMSNNAAVTADDGEIGRAQALQARAAGVAPSSDMNPVLLKPETEIGAQVVVQGRVFGRARAREIQALKPQLLPFVLESFARLQAEADIVLVEGAGSASEINLRRNDIANMGFARAAEVPVVVVGDIDRGGVIANLVGTNAVIDPDDAAQVVGFMVNRMRGDVSLFADGMNEIARRTGWEALGLIPFFEAAKYLPAEDAYDLAGRAREAEPSGRGPIHIVVPVLPRIANFDDLDPLAAEPEVRLTMVQPGTPLPICDLVLLPGSKATIADLATFRAEGWDTDLAAHVRRGGRVLGLCGGYQMLGRVLRDPAGIEGAPGAIEGLGLLDTETEISAEKTLTEVRGVTIADDLPMRGYEMHMGHTSGADTARPLLRFEDGRLDGAVSSDGRIAGTYAHGFFTDDRQRGAFLKSLGGTGAASAYEARVEETLDRLASHLEAHIAIDRLLSLAR